MRLTDFVALYLKSRTVCPDYAKRLRTRATAFQLHRGATDVEQVLNEEAVNEFLSSIDASAYTVRCYRGDLMTLWYAAADLDLTPYPVVRRVLRVARPELLVDCYSIDETRALVAGASELTGHYPNGVAKRDYWGAAVPVAWDAGLRRGDVWRFNPNNVRPDRSMRVLQHKTKRIVTVKLSASTIEAVNRIGRRREPLAWSLDASWFGRHFQTLVKASGVNRGTFKWLRRASGSHVEAEQPGAGHKHLGHSDPKTFERHYDAKLGGHTLPQPPEL